MHAVRFNRLSSTAINILKLLQQLKRSGMQSILQSSALGTLFSCPVPSYFYSMLLFPCPAIAISLSQPVFTHPVPLRDVWHSLTGLLKTRQLRRCGWWGLCSGFHARWKTFANWKLTMLKSFERIHLSSLGFVDFKMPSQLQLHLQFTPWASHCTHTAQLSSFATC